MPRHRPAGGPTLLGRPRVPLPRIPDPAFHGLLLALLAGIEVSARLCRSDVEDGVGLAALLLCVLLVRRRHRRRPLAWVEALGRAGGRTAAAVRGRFAALGIDLRGTPPVARGFPPLLLLATGVLVCSTLLLAGTPSLEPLAVRGAVRTVSALLWLVLLGVSWALFLGGGLYLLFLTFALTHDEAVRAHDGPGPRPRGREFLALLGWGAFLVAGWTLLPDWAPAAVLGACLASVALALSLPGGPDVPLLWRTRGGDGRVLAASWRAHTLAGTAAVGLLLADAALFVRGASLRGGDPRTLEAALPLTSTLAAFFAWTGAAALAAWSRVVLRIAIRARFRDASRPVPTTVLVTDVLPPRERRRVRAALGAAGVRTRFAPAAARRTDVPVSLGPGPAPRGALPLPAASFDSPGSIRRILRRDEIRRRRLLVRGLEKLFRRAAARTFERGQGFWVAPWHWFCIGLSRDEDERTLDGGEGTFFLETVGPAYHRVFPPPVLEHAHRVMRSLQVDLVFVEDGVEFRRFRRVLRMAFEIHDMLGPRGRAEEHHFTGIPGVRVLVHEYTMEEPFRSRREGYPEPDYETVGRARILHVYRDRGESEDPVEAPRDRRGVPLLA